MSTQQTDRPKYATTLLFFQINCDELPIHIQIHTAAIRSSCYLDRTAAHPSLTLHDNWETESTDFELSMLAADIFSMIQLCNFMRFRYVLKISPTLKERSQTLPKFYRSLYNQLWALRTQVVNSED